MKTAPIVQWARVIGFTLASLAATSVGIACTYIPMNAREFDRSVDIIAIGVIETVREQVENAGELNEVAKGVARLDVREYERNREQRGRWIEFRYEHWWHELCGFPVGVRPRQGQTVKIWFGRRGNGFEAIRLEPLDEPESEEPEADES